MTVSVFSRVPFSAYATSTEALVSYVETPARLEFVAPGNKNKRFTDLLPENNRFTPALNDTEHNLVLTQAVAVNRYILSLAKDNKNLLGKNKQEEYETLQWSNRADSDVFQKIMAVFFAIFNGPDATQEKINEAVANAEKGFSVFEEHLLKNTYLVGEQLTLADIEAAGLFYLTFTYFVDAKWQKAHPALVRWGNLVLNGPAYAKKFEGKFAFSKDGDIAGAVNLAKQVVGLIPVEKKAKPEKPKAEKAPAAAAAAEPAKESKPKHPLEALGKSSQPIDAVKRAYSNQETRDFLPWFWSEFFNEDEWSLWKVDFKYNDELDLAFKSNNQIGGFFARLSGSTKYLFGAAVVFGEDHNNGIRGAFLVRGKDYVPAFEVAPDTDSYEFTPLDPKNPKDRAELEDLWAWDKPIVYKGEERAVYDGKVFK